MRKCDNLNGIWDFAYCGETRPEYPFTTTEISDAIVFAVLIVVLLVKPTGLLGKKISEKV